MNSIRRYFAGLILLGAPQLSLSAQDVETYSMSEMVEKGIPPKQTKRVEPVSPEFSGGLAMGMTFYKYNYMPGRVTVDFIIDEQGRVRNARAVRFSNPMLVEPTLEAIQTWRYSPGKMKGELVRVAVTEELGSGELFDPYLRARSAPERPELPPELQWDKAPVPLGAEFSVYPRIALQARQEGLATIKYVIDREGKVVAVQVLESTTLEMGQAAMAAVETREFTPPTKKDGTPCSALQTVTMRFSIHGRAGMMVTPETRKVLRLLEKDPAKIVASEKLDRPLKPVLRRAPVYPVAMRDKNEAGQAEVDVFIDTNGEVQLPAVATSSTPEFGYAAVQAVSTWRFDIPRVAGKPVVTRARIPVVFKPAAPAQN